MGNLLAIYFTDAIYLGQPNAGAGNPLIFDRIENAKSGLIGPRAVIPYFDGHFYVGQDNIYFFSTRGFEEIGTPIVQETIRNCPYPNLVKGTFDPRRNRLLFLFPTDSTSGSVIWSFQLDSKAWSRETYGDSDTYDMIDVGINDTTITWDALGASYPTWDSMSTVTWNTLGATDISYNRLFTDFDNKVHVADDANTVDSTGSNSWTIDTTFESRDHTFEAPDVDKTFTRLAIKIKFPDGVDYLTDDLDFTATTSHDRGRTWKSVGTLTIPAGQDEGKVDFRVTSPHMRFRLVGSSDNHRIATYWITEYTLWVTQRGYDASLGTQE
jgi:hypothetical protein